MAKTKAKTKAKAKKKASKPAKKQSKPSKKRFIAKRASLKNARTKHKKTGKKAPTKALKKKPAKAAPAPKVKIKPVKEMELAKTPIPLTNPAKLFLEIWDPKQESFFLGIRRLFSEYAIPGKTDKQKEENSAQIVEKIESTLRKEPLPEEFIEQLMERYPKERIHQMTSIMSMKPRTTIRLNIIKADIQGFLGSKAAQDLKIKRCQFSPWAFDVPASVNPVTHPAFERCLFELEDEASQMATLLVNARPGQRVLDLCAREGDHTLGISAMMRNKGSLFVFDSDPNRLKSLKQRAQRAGVENIRIVGDSQISEVKSLDAVLVDAPCSGSGVLARQPELKWRFRKEDLTKIHKLQAALLREGARKLKLGGRLVYTTSSLNKSENENQIEHFLKQAHHSYRLVPASEYLRGYVVDFVKNFYGLELSEDQLQSFCEADPFFMLTPDVHGCNGMFAAIIERTRISN